MTKVLRTKLENGIRIAAAILAISLLAGQPAKATNLFWSGNGTSQGGAGTWGTTVARFSDLAGGNPSGTYSVVWNNANVDSAEFGGTSGQVNLAGPIVVNTITTDINGFNIGNANAAGSGGSNTITFSGAGAGINVVNAGTTTTISAVIGANNTLIKSGAGRLEMGNANNPNTVKYVLNGGALTTASIARLSTNAPGALVQDFMTFNGGGWAINTGNQDTGANRGITIKSGGAFFGSSTLTNAGNITISSPIVGTEGGGISIVGNSGPLQQNASTTTAGAVLILNNTANSWDGNATINGPSGSKIITAQSNVIPDTAVVNILASGNVFDMGTNNTTETVRGIAGTAGTVAVGTSGSLTVNVPVAESYTYSSVLTATAAGTGKVTKDGAGTWILSGGSTGFNGEFVMNNGTLGVGGSNIFGNAANTSKVTINGGTLSNTATNGRTIPATVYDITNTYVSGPRAFLNGNFTVDDSLFNTSTPGQILFNCTTTMSADRTITVNGTANVGFADLRESGGSRNLTKAGSGILALTGTTPADPNAFTGSVTVNAGRLQVGGATYVGNETNTIVLSGGNLSTSATRTVQLANPINVTSNSSAITTSSTAATPNFDFSNNNPFTFSSGSIVLTLRNDGGDAATDQLRIRLFGSGFNIANNIDMPTGAASSTVELSSFNTTGTTQTFSGVISGVGDFKRSASTGGTGGTTVMLGQNTFSGGVQLNDGTIELGVDSVGPANAPTSGPVGTGTITIGNINAPKLAANGGARNVGNPIVFSNNTMGITGSNALTLTGDVSLGAGARVLNVDNSALSTMAGTISGAGGSLTKDLTGTLKVTGNNTYDTGTTVAAGTLLVSNTTGSGTGTGAVTVASAGVLGGTGTVGGAISNSGVIAPGEGGVGTLSVTGDVTNSTSGIWHIELSGASSDKLAVTGNVDLSAVGDTLSVTGTGTGSSWLIGTYTGILTGVFENITTGYTVNYTGGNITLNAAVVGLPGDFNNDGQVTAADYATWRKNDGPNATLPNDGGATNQADRFTLWRANFGNGQPGSGSGHGLGGASVPEPSTIALLVMGLLAIGCRRRG